MKKKSYYIASILFLLYLVLLIWIILFKLQFSITALDRAREINLIPFGIYLCLVFQRSRLRSKLLFIAGMSMLLEVCQYVLAVGRSDITDLITNISGGLIGIFLYNTVVRLFHNQRRIDQIIIISATIVTVVVGGGLLFLLAVN